jgi:hypothetical protein
VNSSFIWSCNILKFVPKFLLLRMDIIHKYLFERVTIMCHLD